MSTLTYQGHEVTVVDEGGADAEASAESLLYSTVHGAGQLMSRTQAAGKMGNRAECTRPQLHVLGAMEGISSGRREEAERFTFQADWT